MERAYREDELLDSIVIDSEGYIYGMIGEVEVKEKEVDLLVYETKPDEKTAIDIDALKQKLLERVDLPLSAKIRRLSNVEVLNERIREQLHLKPGEAVSDKDYTKYAEKLGVEIPYAKTAVERKEPKGTVALREVKTLSVSTLGKGENAQLIRAVILNEPKEAKFRKIPVQKDVPYQDTKMTRDKLVIDASGVAVGYVDSIVLYHNTPGMRIYSSRPTQNVNLIYLFRHLEEMGRPDIVAAVKDHFGETVGWNRDVRESGMDIPWEMVHKIGDVVLRKQTLSEFRSKGYRV
jgi:sporulation protein YlmC with PRC-barrel domain